VAVTSTQLTGGQWIGAAVRTQNNGQNAYVGIYKWNFGSPNLRLFKRSSGSWIQLGSTYNSGPLTAGTQLQVKAVGSTISFSQNGVQRITATDTTLSGGAPGIMSFGTGRVDNWSGGTATGTGGGGGTTYTVGGAVSGLSGTAVLQDNGGDNLSVSANGPFTFATALAGGASYSVTVKTNPSGQSCSVSSGSGTIAAANVTNVAVTCTATTTTPGSDDFNRADGSLGSNWTDISDGGLAIALAESAIAGESGFAVTLASDAPWYVTLFAESASRAVVSIAEAKADAFESLAGELGVPSARLGETGGPRMVFDSLFETTVEEAAAVHEASIPKLLAS
jgi:hypothetical protein